MRRLTNIYGLALKQYALIGLLKFLPPAGSVTRRPGIHAGMPE